MSMDYLERRKLEKNQGVELEAIGWTIKHEPITWFDHRAYKLYDHNHNLVAIGSCRSAVYFTARKAIRQRQAELETARKLGRWNKAMGGES